jgi:hypothetical protein
MNAPSKPVSQNVKVYPPLRRSVGKPIHDPDLTSNVSEVRISRMAQKIGGDG